VLHAARWKCRTQKSPKICHLGTIAQLCRAISSQQFGSLGHPIKFQWVSHCGSITARHSGSGHQPNFAALNRGRHLYLAGWPSCSASAPILVLFISYMLLPFHQIYDTRTASNFNDNHHFTAITQDNLH